MGPISASWCPAVFFHKDAAARVNSVTPPRQASAKYLHARLLLVLVSPPLPAAIKDSSPVDREIENRDKEQDRDSSDPGSDGG